MSTGQITLATPTTVMPQYRLSVSQYERMIDGGIIAEDAKVELLDGLLVPKMVRNPAHDTSLDLTTAAIRDLLSKGWRLRSQSAIKLSKSMPEPDLAIVEGSGRDFLRAFPTAEKIALVVEIADSSLSVDRGVKLAAYANGGIQVYWIVNIPERCLEIYTEPKSGKSAGYRKCEVKKANEIVTLMLKNKSVGKIKVADMLP